MKTNPITEPSRLQDITSNYWGVSNSLRSPDGAQLTHEQAFKKLLLADKLRPEEWRLAELMHTLRFDLIEGNTEWRDDEAETGSALILPMKR